MMKYTTSTPDGMEGVVVSRQILVGASALMRRPVLETLQSKGFNQRRQRSTTSKPAMESEPILSQHLHQVVRVSNFSDFSKLNSMPVAFHHQPAHNGVKTSSVLTSSSGFNGFKLFCFHCY